MNDLVKTDTFFIISNYNTDPEQYLNYCNDYHVSDQSTDIELKEKLKIKYSKISFVENTGHNISDYFRFFIDNYANLPKHMMLAKGNMIGRHVTQEFFDRVYANKYYTMLYNDRNFVDKDFVAYQLYDGAFLEINNSWYVPTKIHKYFLNFNDLLLFTFKNPKIPEWTLFAPGACYIITKQQVMKYPKIFYENLLLLLNYTYFPSEAYIVERMLHIIFNSNYDLHDYILDSQQFKQRIEEISEYNLKQALHSKSIKEKFNNFIPDLKAKLRGKSLKLASLFR